MKDLSVVIVHWNTPTELKNTVTELLKDPHLHIVIVDNNSSKKLDTAFLKKHQQITYIQNRTNRGYASACNQGFLHVKTPWVMFLNPDTCITHDSLETLLLQAENQKYAACSPSQLDDAYAKPLPTALSLLAEFTPLKHLAPLSNFKEKTLFGGGLLIKSSVLRDLGGWDERFFLWFEDSDLTKRLLDGGHRIGWVSVDMEHPGGTSFEMLTSSVKKNIFFHSMQIYARKHFGLFGRALTGMLAKRYTHAHVLDMQNEGISVTVPNMQPNILDDFLTQNKKVLEAIDECIIVSSGLTNEQVWGYRASHPDILWIPLEENNGFAHTVNIGLRRSTHVLCGTCNDDTLLSVDFFEAARSNDLSQMGSLNPVIKKADGTIESAGIRVLKKGRAETITDISPDTNQALVDATNAACVLYNKEALNTIGLFDEKFGSYLEDIDLSLRLSRAGFHNYVLLKTSIVHLGQQTSKKLGVKKQWFDFRNWIYVIAKNWSAQDMIAHSGSLLIERLRNLSGIMKAL